MACLIAKAFSSHWDVLIRHEILPSAPFSLKIVSSNLPSALVTDIYVSSNESWPGKSSSNIVILVIVSSPGNLFIPYLSIGSYNSTVKSKSGYQSWLSIISIWKVFSWSSALISSTLSSELYSVPGLAVSLLPPVLIPKENSSFLFLLQTVISM